MKQNIPENYVEVTDLKQMQSLLLYITKRFHEICEENGLFYVMDSGTMLGAVRHKGFIPWDDDVDVSMPRPDYEKFIKLIDEKYSDEFTIEAPEQGNYYLFLAKFGLKGSVLYEATLRKKYCKRNLWIDIFTVDGFPESESNLRKIKFYHHFCMGATLKPFWNKNRSFIRNFTKIAFIPVFYLIGYKHFLKKGLALWKESDFETAEYVSIHQVSHVQISFKKNFYTNRALYDFADTKLWGFADYNGYLSKVYGNYMTLPPENERTPKHGYDLFVKNSTLEKILGIEKSKICST